MPIWGRLRALSTTFAEFRTAVVASTYCNSWILSMVDPADPFRSIARASVELFIARSDGPKERYIERMVELYGVDGIVFHDCRTCPNNTNTRYGMPRRLSERLGIPTLMLDGDVNDLRCFSDEQARTNIEGFVEQLADARSRGQATGARMNRFAGIDSGSWNTKAVIIDDAGNVLGTSVVRSGADLTAAAETAYDAALANAGCARADIAAVWSTGFGRNAVPFANGSRTELDCHGRGAAHYVKGPFVVIDIGGQDAKVIRLDARGQRLSHRMNRKCAAGTGSFLDEIALRLGIETAALDVLASRATEELELSSFCTVFAGTELLTLIRVRPAARGPGDGGVPLADEAGHRDGCLRRTRRRDRRRGGVPSDDGHAALASAARRGDGPAASAGDGRVRRGARRPRRRRLRGHRKRRSGDGFVAGRRGDCP